jgi:transcriptional regulator with XRE-family HTH domain
MNKMAELTGLALTTISYFERALRKPTLETALRIALALDVDLGALIQQATKAIRRSA